MGIAEILALLSTVPAIKGQFMTPLPEYDPNDWRTWYSPSRVHHQVAPTRSALQGREEMQIARSAEEAGGRGVLGGQAHRVQKRAISDDTSRILSQVLGRATESEMKRATDEGLNKFKMDFQKAMSERGGYSQLATTMATPWAIKTGMGYGYGKEPKTPTTAPFSRLSPIPTAPTPLDTTGLNVGQPSTLPQTVIPQTAPVQDTQPLGVNPLLNYLMISQMMQGLKQPSTYGYGVPQYQPQPSVNYLSYLS